ncbi:hypothetical protein PCYB_144930 [Plasmodium cynomolgi strain B]|uniref:Uncharacterized protein n=1 Tax=Plasmodium cynomolgi (strain B) TaxID=1120755 RepID=K6V1N2_PLACD|nr:hypothetical protein PCYB_144930 [Plasmodium cynomolgi strain B]GAB69065.1 hypothetical protein PCYB_144930 [Plasmodium cynomolgi strain B]
MKKNEKYDKNKCIIFSTLLRYKKYLTKKGNTYFDFNQTNLKLNEKELLLQNSNYFHLFDISSLFYPHVYVNVNSHMSVNISDYLNYVKRGSPEKDPPVKDPPVKDSSVDANQIMQYASRQEFILEAIQKVEHIEVFKKVQLVKKLLLTVNREVAQKVQTYVENIPEVNPNDYIFVQTNRKNDLLFGYVKSSKFNLIFEIFNFNKFFKKCHDDNVDITVHEVKDKGSDEPSFVEGGATEGEIYLKEQSIHVKKDVYQNVKFCSDHYCYYYFFKNAPVECIFAEGKRSKKIFTFNLCLKYVKNHLFVLILFNYSPPPKDEKHCVDVEAAVPNLDEMDAHNKHFNLNETDKNVFKRNTFFVHHLYDQLRCKVLSLISFVNFPPNDYLADIHLTKLRRCSYSSPSSSSSPSPSPSSPSSPGGYSFNVYCLSNGGVVYIFICTFMMRDNLCEDSFQFHVSKYHHFELRRKDTTYHSIKAVKCSSTFMRTLCGGGPQRRTRKKVNRRRNNSRGEQFATNNKWEKIPHTLEEETVALLQSENLRKARGNIISSRISSDEEEPTCGSTQMEKYKYFFLIITSKCDLFIVTFRRKKKRGDIELVNYSCTNSSNPNHIIQGVLINKHHFGKTDEGEKKSKGKTVMGHTNGSMPHHHRMKQQSRSCSIFELLCYFQNGDVKKYNFVCTEKEHLEFFLIKNELPRGELLCKKQFFIPILFPFNEEVLKKKKKTTTEKQYENVSLCVNDQCLVITYVKSFCKLLRHICSVMERVRSYQGKLHREGDANFHDQVDILEMGRKSNSRRSNAGGERDADFSPDQRSNFDYLSYDNLVGGISNIPSRENKRKIKINFYHFLQMLIHFQENYVSEGNSFFHLIFNELCQKNVFPTGGNRTNAVGRETSSLQLDPIVDIRTHFSVLFSFFIHMYNFCLKQNGIILYIMLNTLRINNTNLFVNVNYDLRKNNLDYFYLLLLLNFYSIHKILISEGNAQNSLIEDEEENLHLFFDHIFQNKAIPNGDKRNTEKIEEIEIDHDTFERHQILIHDFIKRITSRLKNDPYMIERIYFKINCVFCGKVSVSNLYNNYYICEQKHIFNKCMVTLCCIGKSSLIIPSVYLSRDLSKSVFEEPIGTLQFNLRVKLDCTYFCSFCHLFMTTQNSFFAKHFLFKQCPFCNHDLVAV